MLKIIMEGYIVAIDQDTGSWRRKSVVGKGSVCSILLALLYALEEIQGEAGNYHRVKEIEEMKNGELPF
jgi:hypothetical protein